MNKNILKNCLIKTITFSVLFWLISCKAVLMAIPNDLKFGGRHDEACKKIARYERACPWNAGKYKVLPILDFGVMQGWKEYIDKDEQHPEGEFDFLNEPNWLPSIIIYAKDESILKGCLEECLEGCAKKKQLIDKIIKCGEVSHQFMQNCRAISGKKVQKYGYAIKKAKEYFFALGFDFIDVNCAPKKLDDTVSGVSGRARAFAMKDPDDFFLDILIFKFETEKEFKSDKENVLSDEIYERVRGNAKYKQTLIGRGIIDSVDEKASTQKRNTAPAVNGNRTITAYFAPAVNRNRTIMTNSAPAVNGNRTIMTNSAPAVNGNRTITPYFAPETESETVTKSDTDDKMKAIKQNVYAVTGETKNSKSSCKSKPGNAASENTLENFKISKSESLKNLKQKWDRLLDFEKRILESKTEIEKLRSTLGEGKTEESAALKAISRKCTSAIKKIFDFKMQIIDKKIDKKIDAIEKEASKTKDSTKKKADKLRPQLDQLVKEYNECGPQLDQLVEEYYKLRPQLDQLVEEYYKLRPQLDQLVKEYDEPSPQLIDRLVKEYNERGLKLAQLVEKYNERGLKFAQLVKEPGEFRPLFFQLVEEPCELRPLFSQLVEEYDEPTPQLDQLIEEYNERGLKLDQLVEEPGDLNVQERELVPLQGTDSDGSVIPYTDESSGGNSDVEMKGDGRNSSKRCFQGRTYMTPEKNRLKINIVEGSQNESNGTPPSCELNFGAETSLDDME